ncbi:MAG: DUF6433 family protein, partial [Flammeovirgaceae bacterium]
MATTTTTKKKVTTPKAKPVVVTQKEPETIDLPSNPFAFEVLQLVSKQRTNAKKVEVLKRYDDPSLRTLFIWNFDESVISVLPPGEVPYASVGE